MSDSILPPVDQVDRTKPYTDEQYAEIAKLSDEDKSLYMKGFKSEGWSQQDIQRHYRSMYFPVIKYGPNWTLTPPKRK